MAQKLIHNHKSFLQFSKDFNELFPINRVSNETYILRPQYVLNHVRTGTLNSILINKDLVEL